MRRTNPYGTIAGYVLTTLLLAGLGLALLLTGGLAFSPGPLSAQTGRGATLAGFSSHADFEKTCEHCHQPLVRHMSELCVDCHTNVADQLQAQSGLHGKINDSAHCHTCHSDHRGRDFSPAQAALPGFDHAVTDFDLIHHQVDYEARPMDCTACHDLEDPQFSPLVQQCFACHVFADTGYMEQHLTSFGAACLDCHDGADSMASFEHAATDFPLEGQHLETPCMDCHQGAAQSGMERFSGLSTACLDCHAEPDIHIGVFSLACEECHTPAGWSPARLEGQPFDHAALGFSLAQHTLGYDGQPLTCRGCHAQGLAQIEQQICVDCHTQHDAVFMPAHAAEVGMSVLPPGTGQAGGYCLACHDGVDRMRGFDHNQVFLLDGRHAEVACAACHGGDPLAAVYTGLPGRCVDCHAEPAIHAGSFGLECQECHETSAWSPAFLKEHTFPLDHGEQGLLACTLCHAETFTQYTCYGCHEHQPADIAGEHAEEGIGAAELSDCMECHPDGREEGDD